MYRKESFNQINKNTVDRNIFTVTEIRINLKAKDMKGQQLYVKPNVAACIHLKYFECMYVCTYVHVYIRMHNLYLFLQKNSKWKISLRLSVNIFIFFEISCFCT